MERREIHTCNCGILNIKNSDSRHGDLMTKEELLEIIKKLLKTDTEPELDFLLRLESEELRALVVSIRDRVARHGSQSVS
jgi:hypothetical protein